MELKDRPQAKLADLADSLDMTQQGMSQYLKGMIGDGLIVKSDGRHLLTQKGVEFLHKSFSELKGYVDTGMKDLYLINTCTTLAPV